MNRISPFIRNLAILAVISVAIVLLNQETSLATANALVRVAFFIAIAFAAYMFWRDFGRREIGVWPARAQWVFYGSVALFVVNLGWYFAASLSGRDFLAFIVVAAACVYAAVRTWRRQRHYG